MLAKHGYRSSVRSRWQGVSVAGLGDWESLPARKVHKFDTPAACLAAAQRGSALVLDAEALVER